ncbi:asparagine synthase (glutamine-hydrolyzing) [Micromonospora yasonensis]|uniref:asparagine synthase (glutamine-hydrolyzing) n=1 Tax=Micromonospora yasonensis TaxID=1128667 RepID=UPI00223104CB|nr:asparagine synthase (glutamine-hydrolyzing) [Micromonospora yasonensis]MCW3840374.1 asparagine synthase (glutamine-hydrolyzing) [Micromonospora yasonensis]
MCGITGWVNWERDLTAEGDTVRAMTSPMACRGPDAEGIWLSPRAALGHRRLAIIDLEGGAQPMGAPSPDQPVAVVTFAGEIYNFQELRATLVARGHSLRTRSDTEVLVTAYLEWGPEFVSRLNGMFSFAIWDTRTEELLLVRDRLGVKPLYYAELPDGVLFGSEPKAILANPAFTPELDEEGIAEVFAVPGAPTPWHGTYRGMRAVRPGTTIRFGRSGSRESRYWELESHEHTDDLPTTIGTVRELLADIVERQLVSDVPLGVLLSGGIDSSALTALAVGIVSRQGGGKVRSFSVDFQESEEHFRPDMLHPTLDAPYVRMVADHVGTVHSPIVVDNEDLIRERMVGLAARDLPSWGEMDLSLYLLCRGVARHSTVALSGESADEVFGGYPYFYRPESLAAETFPWMVDDRLGPAGLLRPEVADRVRPGDYIADRYAQALAEVPHLAGEQGRDRRLREVFYLALTRWLPALLDRKDRMSMAASLEVRVPYCDHRLVEYLWNVPWAMKNAGGTPKGLLRQAVADLLPDEVVNRRKSAYPTTQDRRYDVALTAWAREVLADPSAPLFDLVDRARLRELVDAGRPVPGPWMSGMAYLLYVNEWLTRYRVRLV